jgi:hypothetical protein
MDDIQPRWVRVGHSWNSSAYEAGLASARDACDGRDPKLLVVFASFSSYGDCLDELLEGVADAAGDVPVIGCSASGEIGPGATNNQGVVVVGFGGDFEVTTGFATDLGSRPRGVGEELATALLPRVERPHEIALMLTDALAGDQQEMIRGAYGVFGATIPMVGGGAGDNMRMVTSRQIFGGKVLQDAMVGACIGSDGPIGWSISHGWQSQGEPMMVTASLGNSVYALNDLPALDVYLEAHQAPPGIEADPAAFAQFALTRPLAVGRRGDVAVRHVIGAETDKRGLCCAGGVARGASVWLASGDVTSTLDAADHACAEAIAGLDGAPPLALLVFDCAGRRAVLGETGMATEHQMMHHHAGTAPVAGFYSYGEIARLRGTSGFHNQTIIAVAMG